MELLEKEYQTSKEIIRRKIRKKLGLHQGFLHFLSGFDGTIAAPGSSSSSASCLLPRLNLGLETSCNIKQLVADYAGVPTGATLGDLRESYQSLSENVDGDAVKTETEQSEDDQHHFPPRHRSSPSRATGNTPI